MLIDNISYLYNGNEHVFPLDFRTLAKIKAKTDSGAAKESAVVDEKTPRIPVSEIYKVPL